MKSSAVLVLKRVVKDYLSRRPSVHTLICKPMSSRADMGSMTHCPCDLDRSLCLQNQCLLLLLCLGSCYTFACLREILYAANAGIGDVWVYDSLLYLRRRPCRSAPIYDGSAALEQWQTVGTKLLPSSLYLRNGERGCCLVTMRCLVML